MVSFGSQAVAIPYFTTWQFMGRILLKFFLKKIYVFVGLKMKEKRKKSEANTICFRD